MVQATEALKLILGKGRSLIGRLMLYDALEMSFRELKLRKDKKCQLCGDNPSIHQLIDYEEFCGVSTGSSVSPLEASEDSLFELTPEELQVRLEQGEQLTIVDVREPNEYEICRLPNSILIPLGEFPSRVHELSRDEELIIHCKKGGRSAQAVEHLLDAGFTRVKNLVGGIDRWAEKVDPSLQRY